ncbi:MAG: MFS transporter [Candidatus Promineifilaceae bacterium]|nr:MFS transporter [Candidatus Promineifilaceae bacterium]
MDISSTRLTTLLPPLARRPELAPRAFVLALGGRFTDELLSGLFDVLMPTFRLLFGLSYVEVSLLTQSLSYVALVAEPINGLLIDLVRRRRLLAWGAAMLALSMLLMGLASGFAILLLGFVVYGLGSGPLAHTADVVLVEAHPTESERIVARSALFDTVGAFLAPLVVAATFWLGLSWRLPLIAAALYAVVYTLLLLRARFPPPPDSADGAGVAGAWGDLRRNVRAVIANRQMWQWLLFLLAFALFEAPFALKTVWLAEQVGMSQALVALYRALEMAITFLGFLWVDHMLRRVAGRRLLWLALVGLLVVVPAWLLLPGIVARFLLAWPLNFLLAAIWPISLGQLLSSVPGRAGTVTALGSLFGVLPLSLLFGWLAEATSLTAATFLVHIAGLLLMALVLRLMGTR